MNMNKKAFEIFAAAHPHEAYAKWPRRFWLFFREQCPDVTKSEMEAMLKETETPPHNGGGEERMI